MIGVSNDRREHYLIGWLSPIDRFYATEWHMRGLQPHPRKLFSSLWEMRDKWLPAILDDLSSQIYPEYEARLRERVCALLMDAASKLDDSHQNPYRKTVHKYKLVPKPDSYPRTEVVYKAEDIINRMFFGYGGFRFVPVVGILIATAWGILSPEAERFIAYHLSEMYKTVEDYNETRSQKHKEECQLSNAPWSQD